MLEPSIVLDISWLPTVTLASLWIFTWLLELLFSVFAATHLAIKSETNVCGCFIAFLKLNLGIETVQEACCCDC